MDKVKLIFDTSLQMIVQFWNTALGSWGIFGSFIIFYALLRKVANTFNKLKS